ncbi:Uncharacterized protein OS=Lysinibacillus varians GN=T479_01575 PE=4 SV=1 [Gemmata massiliana]|uniref:Uncharacterized protein n=1 Tax=Gemmata massiliana TaxID=1210884 RepID=A0A6P2CY86_9BACT|nr:hypothetical protein [Gemmata massiliana]VTR93346.1 Uncharacterized protein OS=Lysinibacillus varians GN=T479_01575 PE=4 SV=1 [Gemmata massiliana]
MRTVCWAFAIALLFGTPVAAKADPFEEAIKQKVQDKLSNKQFDRHENDVHGGFNKKGRETWINGKSGQAKVTGITKQGTGLDLKYVAKIEVPVTSTYRRKTFIGIGAEYKTESWSTTWTYSVTYTIGFGSNVLTDGKISNASTAADHDAVRWAFEEFQHDIVNKLKD